MKKVALIFLLIVPFLADAQVRIWQLSSRDKTNAVQPAGKIPMADGLGSFEFGNIDTSKVVGLSQYIINHSIQSATDSVKLDGSVLQIFSAGSSTPTTVDLSSIVSEAGEIDSMKFEASYLKVFQNGASVPDSVLIDVTGSETDPVFSAHLAAEITAADTTRWGAAGIETDPVFSAWDKDYNDLTNTPTTTDDQTAAEVTAADVGDYFDGTNVEDILQELGADIASGGDNWGSQVVEIGDGLSGQGTTASPLTTTLQGNATHTGEVTGSDALTIADNVIDYGNVAATLKGAATDNDGAWDFSANGIVNATISSAVSVTLSNLQVNKSLKIKLAVSAGGSIGWPAGCVVLDGSATIEAGSTYYIFLDCWASDLVLVSITKAAA